MKQHLKTWWHVHTAILLGAALSFAFLAGAFTSSGYWKNVYGVKLSPKGVHIYQHIAGEHVEHGGKAGTVHLTAKQITHLKVSAEAAASQLHPEPLATPQPKVLYQPIPDNYSSRPAGTKYELLVAHDTESPNAPGIADLEAIRAWFSNPNAQASANYVDDAQGNTLELVNPATRKAWHVAYFNPWAIGVEEVGYATQTHWPLLQIEATARIFAHWAMKYGIPIRRGKVSGCTIVRTGIVEHADLGLCGGGHHDDGAHYPLAELIRLTKMYANAGHVKPKAHKPLPVCKVKAIQYQLNRHGQKPKLTLDGIAGPLTRAALAKAGGVKHLGLHCRVTW